MSRHYFYLVASLPTLVPDGQAVLSGDDFLAVCRQHLGGRDFEQVAATRIDGFDRRPANPVGAAWHAFDSDLREQLLRLRATGLGWDEGDFSRGGEAEVIVTEAVRAVFEQADPLAAESGLFDLRWRFLDEIDRCCFMRLENVLVYALKLQLIAGRRAMTPDRGEAALTAIRSGFAALLPTWDAP